MEYVTFLREQDNCVSLISDLYNHIVLSFFSEQQILVLLQVFVGRVWYLHGT